MEIYLLKDGCEKVPGIPKEKLYEVEGDRILLLNSAEFEEIFDKDKQTGTDILNDMQLLKYCKAERRRGYVCGVVHAPRLREAEQNAFSFGFYMDRHELWLVSDDDFIHRVKTMVFEETDADDSLQDVLLGFFNNMIANDVMYLQKSEKHLEKYEESIIGGKCGNFHKTVISYKKYISVCGAYYMQLSEIGDYMQNIFRNEESGSRFGWELFSDRAERLHNYTDTIQEYLTQLRELYQSQIDINQNRIMTILTVVTTLVLPLSLIAGWYGMNFTNMPELHWKYSYLAVAVVSVLIIAVEIYYFKKKKIL